MGLFFLTFVLFLAAIPMQKTHRSITKTASTASSRLPTAAGELGSLSHSCLIVSFIMDENSCYHYLYSSKGYFILKLTLLSLPAPGGP